MLCKSNGKYDVKLTDIEAVCYWTNFPNAGEAIQNQSLPLNAMTASYSWNYEANKDGGALRNIICDKMKKLNTSGNQLMMVILL